MWSGTGTAATTTMYPDFPLPEALSRRGYLKLALLALALLRFVPLGICGSAARHTSPLGLGKKLLFSLETDEGKFTSWCELPWEHLLPLDHSVFPLSRWR